MTRASARSRLSTVVVATFFAACGSPAPALPSDRGSIDPGEESASMAPSIAPATPSAPPSAGSAGPEQTAIAVGGGPDMPTEAFGSIWVLTVDGPLMGDGVPESVQRIDPATNEVIASIPLPGRLCQGIGASPEAVWACGPDGLVRIDPATNAVVATVGFPAPLAVSRIAYGAGSVWSFSTAAVGPDTIVRIDPTTNGITATIPLGHVAGTMAFGSDALWVTSPTDDVVLRIDPATNAVAELTAGIEGAGQIAVSDDGVWVSLYGLTGEQAPESAPTIVRIDSATGEVTAEVDAGESLEDSNGIAATPTGIWVRAGDPFLVRIDPATAEIVETIEGNHFTGDVAVAFGAVWATSEQGRVIRVDIDP